MTEEKRVHERNLPREWVELAEYAMHSGITKEEFLEFLNVKREEANNSTIKK